jgi:hypothetical protein
MSFAVFRVSDFQFSDSRTRKTEAGCLKASVLLQSEQYEH